MTRVRNNQSAFTLIELLVVIAIIAILAAILFPVFAQAREKARQASCLSNLNQMGLASNMYIQDYDETFYPHRWNSGPNSNPLLQQLNVTCSDSGPISGVACNKTFWISLLQPYVKNYQIWQCPSNPNGWVEGRAGTMCGGADNAPSIGCGGNGYGGQNSYGHNDVWMSPAANFATPFGGAVATVADAAVIRPSGTVMIVDSTYYGAAPDLCNESGHMINAAPVGGGTAPTNSASNADCAYAQSQAAPASFYDNYWMNIGNSNWSYSGGTVQPAQGIQLGQNRHSGVINVQFVDGHTKAIPYFTLIGNICLWDATDADAAHPWCN